MGRWLMVLCLAAGAAMQAGAAQACAILAKLEAQHVAATPVVVRGEVLAVTPVENLGVELTIAVAETLQGTEAGRWVVTWGAESVVVPPHGLPEFAGRYGLEIVIGFVPDGPGFDGGTPPARIDIGTGSMPRVACGEPFVGSYAELEPLLREAGLVE